MGPFQLPPAIRPSGKHRMGYKAGSARGSAGKRKGPQSSQSGQGLRKATGLERGYRPILQVSKLRLGRGRHLLQSHRPQCQDLPASGTCGHTAGGAARTSRQPLSTRPQAHSHGQGQPHCMIVRGSGTGFLSIQTHWGFPSICLQAEVTWMTFGSLHGESLGRGLRDPVGSTGPITYSHRQGQQLLAHLPSPQLLVTILPLTAPQTTQQIPELGLRLLVESQLGTVGGALQRRSLCKLDTPAHSRAPEAWTFL